MFTTTNADYDRCQQESIDFLAARFHAACGDAPGLGKTRTAVKAAKKVGAITGLVVTLGSQRVRKQWADEIVLHYGERDGCRHWRVLSFNAAINSEIIASLAGHYDVVIVDEEHRCKDMESQWSRAVLGRGGLTSRGTYKWMLSGTFMPNYRPVELFPMLKTLHPAFAQMSFLDYARRFCGGYFDGRAWQANGASNTDALNDLLRDFLIAHTKRQAFPGRKEPVLIPVPFDLDERELSAVIEREREIISREAKISSSQEFYSQLGDAATLRRLTGLAMVPQALQFALEKLESNDKIALFFQHTAVGEALFHGLVKAGVVCAWYAGGMSGQQQAAAIAAFKTGARVLVGQQQAAGTGVDGLQGCADTLVFAEPDWTPGETEQRVNRFDRIGTTADLVTAYVLYARGTLGAAVWGVHGRKVAVGQRAGWV